MVNLLPAGVLFLAASWAEEFITMNRAQKRERGIISFIA
jgi:hypothetical protein